MKEKVFTREKWANVNKDNKSLLSDYLIELKSKKRRPKTIEQYGYDGRMVLCYILDHMQNQSILDLNKKDFRRITLWLLEERQVSNARFNRVFALIKGMLEYAEDEEDYLYEKNVARKIKGLSKEPVRDIHFLTDEQIHSLRKYLIEHRLYKQCVFLDMAYDSAGRIGEIHQVQKFDLLSKRVTNTVVGKRGKKFKLIYHSNTLESLKLYLDERDYDDIDSLWVGGEGEFRHALTDGALYAWCKQMTYILMDIEGTFIDFTPHSFRHSALENYKKGTHYVCKQIGRAFTIEELQVLAHHESIDMTKSYLKNDDNDILSNMFGIKVD